MGIKSLDILWALAKGYSLALGLLSGTEYLVRLGARSYIFHSITGGPEHQNIPRNYIRNFPFNIGWIFGAPKYKDMPCFGLIYLALNIWLALITEYS